MAAPLSLPLHLPGRATRLADIALALVLGGLCAPLLALAMGAIWLCDGRPVFYPSERMRAPGRPFTLWKLRTMRPSALPPGPMGGARRADVTALGHWLRRSRIDELPQLWCVLRGEMGLVGPRPPLRAHVEAHPALYAHVLCVRPGLTGLATLACHPHEALLLARCATTEDAEALYARLLIPRKARLDMLWLARRSFWGDMALIGRTGLRLVTPRGWRFGVVRRARASVGRCRWFRPFPVFKVPLGRRARPFMPARAHAVAARARNPDQGPCHESPCI